MGRRPHRCYRVIAGKPFPKSRYNRGVPDGKIRAWDIGFKRGTHDALPIRICLVSKELEQISSESLEAARVAANKQLLIKCKKEGYHLKMMLHPWNVVRINKMLSCAGADRLQTGMRGAYGKPYGKVARVDIDQVIMSVRTTEEHILTAKDALRRASMKFPGRQKGFVSIKMGFSDLTHQEYLKANKEGRIKGDGAFCRIRSMRGPLKNILK